MNEAIRFEYQDIAKDTPMQYRAVALNEPLKYFAVHYKLKNGVPVSYLNEMTTRDCRNIDGCVYFAKGRVSDKEMVHLIELFQKVLKEKGWKKNEGAGFSMEQQQEIEESV